jgi:TetR/AcrR family transcriptional regulator, cholesterol catabolism regulator
MTPRSTTTAKARLANDRYKSTKGSAARPRRQAIFDRAVKLMRDRGFHGTSIQDVADKLRFTKAAFYYYVKNKEDMLYEISLQTLRLMLNRVTSIAASRQSPEQKMRAIVDTYVKLMVEEPGLFIVYFREKRFLGAKHRKEVTAAERHILRVLERIYREGVKRKQFRKLDASVAVLGILGMCFWVCNWYEPKGRLSGSEIARAFQTMVLSGVLAAHR